MVLAACSIRVLKRTRSVAAAGRRDTPVELSRNQVPPPPRMRGGARPLVRPPYKTNDKDLAGGSQSSPAPCSFFRFPPPGAISALLVLKGPALGPFASTPPGPASIDTALNGPMPIFNSAQPDADATSGNTTKTNIRPRRHVPLPRSSTTSLHGKPRRTGGPGAANLYAQGRDLNLGRLDSGRTPSQQNGKDYQKHGGRFDHCYISSMFPNLRYRQLCRRHKVAVRPERSSSTQKICRATPQAPAVRHARVGPNRLPRSRVAVVHQRSDFRAVFVFHDRGAMQDFVTNGWEVGAHADAAAKAGDKGGAVGGEIVLDGITMTRSRARARACGPSEEAPTGRSAWVSPRPSCAAPRLVGVESGVVRPEAHERQRLPDPH